MDRVEVTREWFPCCRADLDAWTDRLIEVADANDQINNGDRRCELRRLAGGYRHGLELPRVDYTPEEVQTWGQVYRALAELHPSHACQEYIDAFRLLESEGLFSPDAIPQFGPLSDFLRRRTNFTMRPVAGMLSSRQFLAGLAVRVFHGTQFIRPPNCPFDAPEPDICHELLGHVPLLSHRPIADLSQVVGLASLGASEDDIKRLSSVYWFTLEFGQCRDTKGDLKAFGAGLLGCVDELRFSLSQGAARRPLNLEEATNAEYPLTGRKPMYYVAPSFDSIFSSVMEFCRTIKRPFDVNYNKTTERIEITYHDQ